MTSPSPVGADTHLATPSGNVMDTPHAPQSPPNSDLRRDIVVIGASAGGLRVLLDLASALPAGLPAAVLMVLHVGAHRSVLPELLSKRGAIRAIHPVHGQPLLPGTIYVAPPDHHMMVENDLIQVQRGAKEHHARPAIDPLFRAAALAYGPRVIGVVLSGRLDDGTAGLQAIKRCGGLAVVQEPADAEHPDMPASALDNVAVDFCVPRERLAETLLALVNQPAGPWPAAPAQIACEQAISIGVGNPMEHLNTIGKPSCFACPDCDGVLWEIEASRPKRYRCHTGHGYSLRSLVHTQQMATDHALWAAIRALQDREKLLRTLAEAGDRAAEDLEVAALVAEAERVARHSVELQRLVSAG